MLIAFQIYSFTIFDLGFGSFRYDNLTKMRSLEAIYHPAYNKNPRSNDIGIIITPTPITMSEHVSVIALPPPFTIIPFEYGQHFRISGFGRVDDKIGTPKYLQTTYDQQIVSNTECKIKEPSSLFCARGLSNWCWEDRGGGAIILKEGKKILVGIAVEYSVNCTGGPQAAAFTEIIQFRDWIHIITGM